MSCASAFDDSAVRAIRSDIDTRIAGFAEREPVSSQADELLGRLRSASSPVLKSWLAARGLQANDELTVATEWRRYYAKNFALAAYPTSDPRLNSAIENLVDAALATHATDAAHAHLEALFGRAKTASMETASRLIPEPARKAAIERIRDIRLLRAAKLADAPNKARPLEILDWGVAYDPVQNAIQYGVHGLGHPNDETTLAIFAHEIGHSLDSCRWGAFFDGPWPFERVGTCLRSPASVGAKPRDDVPLERLSAQGKLSPNLVLALRANPTCNKSSYPPIGTQADQLPEAFADWFSAEVVGRMALERRERVRSDLCAPRALQEGSSYPSNPDRLLRIYWANPDVRPASEPNRGALRCAME